MKSFFRPSALLFIALWLFLLIGGRSRFFQDPGTFWHTAVGGKILGGKVIGKLDFFDTDPYTFTFAGKPWIPHQWLGECMMFAIDRYGGFDSLLLVTATILAAVFSWLGARLMHCGLHPSLAALLTALAVAASSGHFHVRPHLATFIGFAITLVWLADFEAGQAGLGKLCWLIPIYWVWSNIHGGMLGGLGTFIVVVAGWTASRAIGAASPLKSYRDAAKLGLLILACAGTALLNPYGYRLPEAWLSISQMHSLSTLINEHSPIDFADANAWMILLLALVYITLLVGVRPFKIRITWLIPLIWFVLCCGRIRHAPLFAIAALIAVADVFPHTRYAQRLLALGSDLFQPGERRRPNWSCRLKSLVLPVLLVALAMILQGLRVQMTVIGYGWVQLNTRKWPVENLDALLAEQGKGDQRIFDDFGYGGFLIYYVPGYKVFIDDRCELFGDAFLEEFVKSDDSGRATEAVHRWEKQYGEFGYALVSKASGHDDYFHDSPEWILLSESEPARFYQRARMHE